MLRKEKKWNHIKCRIKATIGGKSERQINIETKNKGNQLKTVKYDIGKSWNK